MGAHIHDAVAPGLEKQAALMLPRTAAATKRWLAVTDELAQRVNYSIKVVLL